MEKRVKGLLVAGTVACGLGAVMFGAGAALGGGGYVGAADLNKMDGGARLDERISMEKTKIEGFDRIDAEIKDTDFKILPSEDENYYLSYQIRNAKREEPVEYKVEDGMLKLSEQKNSSGVVFMQVDLSFISYLLGNKEMLEEEDEVVLYVPKEKQFGQSRIFVDDGDLMLEGFEGQDIELRQDFGDIALKDCIFNGGTITSENGALSASQLSCKDTKVLVKFGDLSFDTAALEDCTVEISDGKMDAEELAILGETVIENDFGDVVLHLTEECKESLSMEFETKFGDIELQDGWDGSGNMVKEDGTANYRRTVPDPAGNFRVTLKDGDLTLN